MSRVKADGNTKVLELQPAMTDGVPTVSYGADQLGNGVKLFDKITDSAIAKVKLRAIATVDGTNSEGEQTTYDITGQTKVNGSWQDWPTSSKPGYCQLVIQMDDLPQGKNPIHFRLQFQAEGEEPIPVDPIAIIKKET